MPFCTNCGKEIQAETTICPYCEILVEPEKALRPTQPVSNLVSFRSKDGHSISLGKILIVGFFCFLLFGVMLGGLRMVYDYQRIASTLTEQTLATIIDTETLGEDDQLLTVRFVEKNTGNQITAKCEAIDQPWFYEGQRVSILYDPINPTDAVLKSAYGEGYLITALVAVLPGAIIIVFIITTLMKRRAIQLKIDRPTNT